MTPTRKKRNRFLFVLLCLAAPGLAACSNPGAATVPSGTVRWAEYAASPPTYIFPFTSLAQSDISNVEQFQYLMYRPLYSFGAEGRPTLDLLRSLASAPSFSRHDSAVTIVLKNYRWSNGERVDAEDVMFWMNMLHSEKENWADYTPGSFPDNLTDVRIDGTRTLTFTFNRPYNPHWILYNELSQITPMPRAWDIVHPGGQAGSGRCASASYGDADLACRGVYTFLSQEAGYDPADPTAAAALDSYAKNPLWQVVDGPWRLVAFDGDGDVTMEANQRYSGPIKPSFHRFIEVPFLSDSAELDALLAGNVDVGYLPIQYAPPTSDPENVRVNYSRLGGYHVDPYYVWGVAYLPYNFNSTGDGGAAGAVFRQLYFRQAFQSLVDQPLYVRKLFKGYGIPEFGPVGALPANPFWTEGLRTNPYPYDPNRAEQLLSDHGWQIRAGAASVCIRPGTGRGECGKGIGPGTPLSFTLEYPTHEATVTSALAAEQSSWSQAGIAVSLRPVPASVLYTDDTPCRPGPSCTWEIAIGGWVYQPDTYPSGETLFASGSLSNVGNYSDPVNDRNIRQTYLTEASLGRYETYLEKQLPVVWQPLEVASLTEIRRSLTGVSPQNVLGYLTPEDWRVKS
jgi:peptide/nickel transport system substrate-binding protein